MLSGVCGVRPRLQRRDRDGFAPSSLFSRGNAPRAPKSAGIVSLAVTIATEQFQTSNGHQNTPSLQQITSGPQLVYNERTDIDFIRTSTGERFASRSNYLTFALTQRKPMASSPAVTDTLRRAVLVSLSNLSFHDPLRMTMNLFSPSTGFAAVPSAGVPE